MARILAPPKRKFFTFATPRTGHLSETSIGFPKAFHGDRKFFSLCLLRVFDVTLFPLDLAYEIGVLIYPEN